MACFLPKQSYQQASLCPYNPPLTFQHKNSALSPFQKLLVSYVKIRKTTTDISKYRVRIAQILHRRLCKTGRCKCHRLFSVFNHVESCLDLKCAVCKPLRSFCVQNAVDLKDSFGNGFSNSTRPDIADHYPHRSKRVKVGSPETQYFQPSSITQAQVQLTDDVYIESGITTYSEEKILPTFLNEIEMDNAEEEKVVLVKSEPAKQAPTADPRKGGVSILDFFTADEIQKHLSSLRKSSDQDAKESKTMNPCDDNTCNLCGNQILKFAPKPMYCLTCTGRIKEGVVYYSTFDENASKSCVCGTCYNRGGHLTLDGNTISKSKLQKEKNDVADDEPWVQCDTCGGWQHQICALYNDKTDLSGSIEYRCPKCYLVRIESGDHVPIQDIPTFGAKNLPTTKLSDYIEKRLLNRLNRDRKERAKMSERSFDEVPGATNLVVRVVVSANKMLKVNEQFSQIFPNVTYPSKFPYRSKVILLFQKIEGIEICLFAMYVQEYGSECGRPNQRSVYISHIDSVKQFVPNVRSACGEALRTFAYHEILIGYLDYCKKRGFTTAYIWSCPPLKGDDYIFYCHPKTQKTPKPDSLRQWYKSMLKKASKENIVIDFTNFYDHYFVPNEESNIKVSAARLPYFDGDYWTTAAIAMINKIEKGTQANLNKSKQVSRRTLRALGHNDLSEDATKDILLMQQLGETILPSKDDFIMVHLQVTCTNCHEPILSQTKWHCKKCKNFLLCLKCHKHIGSRHTSWSGERHSIYQAPVSDDVAAHTDDEDALLETVLFEDKNSFLSFCQSNDYQFDELRRAKHSSMMILYHLHGSIKKATQDCEENAELPRIKNMGLRLHDSIKETSQDCGKKVENAELPRIKKTGLRTARIYLRPRMKIYTLSHLKGR